MHNECGEITIQIAPQGTCFSLQNFSDDRDGTAKLRRAQGIVATALEPLSTPGLPVKACFPSGMG